MCNWILIRRKFCKICRIDSAPLGSSIGLMAHLSGVGEVLMLCPIEMADEDMTIG